MRDETPRDAGGVEDSEVGVHPFPVAELSVYDEATTLPGSRVLALPVHPGVEVAAGWPLVGGVTTRLDARAHLGTFVHAPLAVGVTLDAGLAVEQAFSFGGVLGAELGLGVLESVSSTGEFVQDDEGDYRFRWDLGRLAVRPALAAEAGWRLGAAAAPRVLLRYRVWAEAPFSPGFIPLMVHGDTGLVVRLAFGGGEP